MHLKNGTLLQGGTYRIVSFIKSGGFGCTYEAVHLLLNKRVAIKEFFVKDCCNRDETGRITVGILSKTSLVDRLKQKFIAEASKLSALNHEGIVNVSNLFLENETAYYVMDYIDGYSLDVYLQQNGPLSEEVALDYIDQTCEVLKYVHEKNMLHLDIKPGNLMVDNEGKVRLIDFGTAKQYDEYEGENTSTLLGSTPGYSAPEQNNSKVTSFTPATDVYSLGATLYKLLSGITPPTSSERSSGEELSALPANISQSTSDAIIKAMLLNKKERLQSVDEFQALLRSKVVVEQPASEETVIVNQLSGTRGTAKWVDLGLSVKWATCNVGASTPGAYGNYYAWGETSPKPEYSWNNSASKGKAWNDIGGNSSRDAATANWGGKWRLPTKAEFQELVNSCTWEWAIQNGNKGYKVTGPNGQSLFLPAAGYRIDAALFDHGEVGYYWSSAPHEINDNFAYMFYFGEGDKRMDWYNRSLGRSVRPVLEK